MEKGVMTKDTILMACFFFMSSTYFNLSWDDIIKLGITLVGFLYTIYRVWRIGKNVFLHVKTELDKIKPHTELLKKYQAIFEAQQKELNKAIEAIKEKKEVPEK